jgi:hypothetical protein
MNVRVRVAIGFSRGAPPPPGAVSATPRTEPAHGATVRVIRQSDRQLVATGTTDVSGFTTLALAPDAYWFSVPWAREIPGRPGAPAVGANLPDGTPVMAWSAVSVGPASSPDIVLTIMTLGM